MTHSGWLLLVVAVPAVVDAAVAVDEPMGLDVVVAVVVVVFDSYGPSVVEIDDEEVSIIVLELVVSGIGVP
jgi:hypothetical protein